MVEEAVGEVINNGIYILETSNRPYVGRSVDIETRYQQHIDDGTRKIRNTIAKIDFPFTRNSQRVLEQKMIELVESIYGETSNSRNEVAENPRSRNSRRLRRIINGLDFCNK